MLVILCTICIIECCLIFVTNGLPNETLLTRNVIKDGNATSKLTVVPNEMYIKLICNNSKTWHTWGKRSTSQNNDIQRNSQDLIFGSIHFHNQGIYFCVDVNKKILRRFRVIVLPDGVAHIRWKRSMFDLIPEKPLTSISSIRNHSRLKSKTRQAYQGETANDIPDSILYLTVAIVSIVVLGAIFYCCTKKLYLQRDHSTELDNHYRPNYNRDVSSLMPLHSVPLNMVDLRYVDVPPSYDKSMEDRPPPIYEEVLLDEKSKSTLDDSRP